MGKDKKSLQRSRAKKKARTAARKKQQKQNQNRSSGILATIGFSRREIGEAPIHVAYVAAEIMETGFGHVIVARQLPDARIIAGFILLDVYCLGVKDARVAVLSPMEFEQTVAKHYQVTQLRAVDAAYTRKLVDGAIAYARDLGFEPHRDFRQAEPLLATIDASECTEEFVYGKDGKPFFVSGPFISVARSRQIIEQLQRRCGDGGFDYLVGLHGPPEGVEFDEDIDDELDDEGEED